MHPPAVVTLFTISCAVKLLRFVTSEDIMTSLPKKKVISIDRNSRSQIAMESVWSASKLLTESVGSRRKLVANRVHTTDAADANAIESRCRR